MATKPTPAAKPAAKPAPAKSAPAKAAEPVSDPGVITVTARLSKEKDPDQRTVSVEYNFGADLEQAVEIFGSDIIFQKAIDSLVIDCQANIRRRIAKGETDEQIAEAIAAWKPTLGSGGPRKSPVEKIENLVAKMTPEQKAEVLAALRAQAGV